MPHTTKRHNRAFRIAYWTDVQRIFYTVALPAFVHSWALQILALLIPSALTVLQFLAALNRTGRAGYIGCAVAYSLLAPQIAAATQRKCAPRTLQRGLACLRALGLVELRYWTMPDQRLQVGGREIRLKGTGRVETADGWKSLQIRIVVLTDRALALWDRSTQGQGDRIIALFPTSANLADRSQLDQCVNTHMIDQGHSDRVSSADECQEMLISEQSDPVSSPPSTPNEKGRSTSPPAPVPERPIVEQRALTPDVQAQQTEPQQGTSEPSSGARTSCPPSTQHKPLGCSAERPKIPRGAQKRGSWSIGRLIILNELHKILERFSQREADTIYNRAKWELSRDYPAGWPTSVDWPYWVGRFGDFPPARRKFHIMRDILPLLKAKVPISPAESARFRQGAPEKPDRPVRLAAALDPFLADIFNRVKDKLE